MIVRSDKISALAWLPEPDNIKTLRSFLGFSGYYRGFIYDYANIVKPWNDLLFGHPTHTPVSKKKNYSSSLQGIKPGSSNSEANTLLSRLKVV